MWVKDIDTLDFIFFELYGKSIIVTLIQILIGIVCIIGETQEISYREIIEGKLHMNKLVSN
jgi:hypothetical protein